MSALEANLAKANRYLARFRDGCVLHQIGGEAVPASDGATFDTISPVDLKPLAKVAHGKAADVDRAARAAKRLPDGQLFPAKSASKFCTKSQMRSSPARKRSLLSNAWIPARH